MQVYISWTNATIPVPIRQLVGVRRVNIPAGNIERDKVSIHVSLILCTCTYTYNLVCVNEKSKPNHLHIYHNNGTNCFVCAFMCMCFCCCCCCCWCVCISMVLPKSLVTTMQPWIILLVVDSCYNQSSNKHGHGYISGPSLSCTLLVVDSCYN